MYIYSLPTPFLSCLRGYSQMLLLFCILTTSSSYIYEPRFYHMLLFLNKYFAGILLFPDFIFIQFSPPLTLSLISSFFLPTPFVNFNFFPSPFSHEITSKRFSLPSYPLLFVDFRSALYNVPQIPHPFLLLIFPSPSLHSLNSLSSY